MSGRDSLWYVIKHLEKFLPAIYLRSGKSILYCLIRQFVRNKFLSAVMHLLQINSETTPSTIATMHIIK